MFNFRVIPILTINEGKLVKTFKFNNNTYVGDPINTVKILQENLSHIKTPIPLSIIGCVVNGPGEAAQTEIGITGGGKGNHMMYLNGVESEKIKSEEIISKVVSMVEKKVKEIEEKNQ